MSELPVPNTDMNDGNATGMLLAGCVGMLGDQAAGLLEYPRGEDDSEVSTDLGL